jgi:radical SAM protein with 4Fe4S-binding SPASM domain
MPRMVIIPQVDHDIFHSINCQIALDIIQRAITDIVINADKDPKALDSIITVEPDLKNFFQKVPFSQAHILLSPSGQRVMGSQPESAQIVNHDPIIANIEITTYCNLSCQFCARSLLNKHNQHMSFGLFRNILALLPNTYKIVLVGLGEPLLHPEISEFIQYTKSTGRKVGMVTNAMLLSADISYRLLTAGLDSIVFSIDGYDAAVSSRVRKGTDFQKIITNIKEFVKIAKSMPKPFLRPVSKAVFSAVSIDTVSHLKDLVDTVSDLGVDVLMLSDINFKTNLEHTLWQNVDENIEAMVRKGITYAFSKNLPVLSVHGLEEFGLEKRYHDFLMIPPGQLYQRSATHRWCFSPWQTIPVDVEGKITLCDCQPDFVVGHLLKDSFSKIWNGETMQEYRQAMYSKNPPETCKICPRF